VAPLIFFPLNEFSELAAWRARDLGFDMNRRRQTPAGAGGHCTTCARL
jgi:hypothetical protein